MQYHHAAHAESVDTIVDYAMSETAMLPKQLGSAFQYVACEFVLDLQTIKVLHLIEGSVDETMPRATPHERRVWHA
jgi:hypothetical protein